MAPPVVTLPSVVSAPIPAPPPSGVSAEIPVVAPPVVTLPSVVSAPIPAPPPSGVSAEIPVVARPVVTLPSVVSAPIPAPVAAPSAIGEEGATSKGTWHAKVAGIIDGCTIEVKTRQNQIRKIRLAGIVCLPIQSLAGKEARLFTTRSIFVQDVEVAITGEEGGVLIADVSDRDHVLLNRTLVQQGLVNATELRFRRDEENARTRRRGLWQNPTTWLHAP
ncbi:MAG: hypothetical protein HQL84_08565 [Magnetococcales bacterium]|nr:hypothetical protein [Magnetococcales bacterium]MBF0150083.1 hypothetical protein [Magnetococcales bacterium]